MCASDSPNNKNKRLVATWLMLEIQCVIQSRSDRFIDLEFPILLFFAKLILSAHANEMDEQIDNEETTAFGFFSTYQTMKEGWELICEKKMDESNPVHYTSFQDKEHLPFSVRNFDELYGALEERKLIANV